MMYTNNIATVNLDQLNNLITRVESALDRFDELSFEVGFLDENGFGLTQPVYLKSWEKKLPELKALAAAVNQFDAEISAVESL